jgi:uncharacterized repeat protein (TIGR03803 family)
MASGIGGKMSGISGSLFAGAIACGLLLQVPAAHAAGEKVMYTFCSQQDCTDGVNPISDLIDVNGTFYGVTLAGGTGDCGSGSTCGTVFAFDPRTRSKTVLHSFKDSETDGIFPTSGVIDVKGILYGTTMAGGGGSSGGGTVFALDPQTGAESLLHSFTGGSDGYTPWAGLVGVKDMLYGTTSAGGGNGCGGGGCGTVFAINRKTGKETVLHTFDGGAGGAVPMGALTEVNGTLYGTTSQGGSTQECFTGCGTVFAIDPKTGATTVVYTFAGGSDGSDPTARLLNVNGTLYGTTAAGGANNRGTVFSLDLQTGSEAVLYSFCNQQDCRDGSDPGLGTLIDLDGTLYGTTAGGGGTVFAVDAVSGAETVLYSFGSKMNEVDGANPDGGVIAKGQWLYGTTLYGGIHADGVLFRIKR